MRRSRKLSHSAVNSSGNLDIQRGAYESASAYFEQARELAERQLSRDSGDGPWRDKLCNALSKLGYEEAQQVATNIVADIPAPTTQSRKDLADVYIYLGQIAEQRNRPGAAADWFEKALEIATAAYEEGLGWEQLSAQTFITVKDQIATLRAGLNDAGTPQATDVDGQKEGRQ